MNNIYLKIHGRPEGEQPMVLATVTAVKGSTPQKPGSSALFGKNGLIAGTVGGGVTEKKVEDIVKDVIQTKESGLYHFDLYSDISDLQEAICGGQISILIDAAPENHWAAFSKMRDSITNRIPGVLITELTQSADEQDKIIRYWATKEMDGLLANLLPLQVAKAVKDILSGEIIPDFRKANLSAGQEEVLYFIEPVFPLPRLVIAGAGHIGKALTHLGSLLDFEVTVIDDRAEYANSHNLPGAANIIVGNIEKAIREIEISYDTYIVIVTRGHSDDAGALKSCIGSDAAYIGMIGSARKIELIRQNFIETGIATPDRWKRIYAPVGLDINSKTVQEIAVSIVAQLIKIRNTKKTG